MTDPQPRPDAEEPAIVQTIRHFRAEEIDATYTLSRMSARQLLEYLDAIKARASEPSERERELEAVLKAALHEWSEDEGWTTRAQELLGEARPRTLRYDELRAHSDKMTELLNESVQQTTDAQRACDRLQSELTVARRSLEELNEERDRLQSELSEARAALAKRDECIDESLDWLNGLLTYVSEELRLDASRVERELRQGIRFLQSAAEKAEEKPERCPRCGCDGSCPEVCCCPDCQGTGKKPTEEKTECDGCARARSGDYFITTGDPATVQCPKCNAVHPRDAKEGHPIERLTRDDNDAKQLKRLSGTAVLSDKIDDYDTRWAILTLVEYLREERRAR